MVNSQHKVQIVDRCQQFSNKKMLFDVVTTNIFIIVSIFLKIVTYTQNAFRHVFWLLILKSFTKLEFLANGKKRFMLLPEKFSFRVKLRSSQSFHQAREQLEVAWGKVWTVGGCSIIFSMLCSFRNSVKLRIHSRMLCLRACLENLFSRILPVNQGKMTNQLRRQLRENCWRDRKIFPRTWKRKKIQMNMVPAEPQKSFVFIEKTARRWFATNCLQTQFVNKMFASVYATLRNVS